MISSDIADNFFSNRDKLLCHKSGDIAFAMWIYDIMKTKNITWFADNKRIHHHPPASERMDFFKKRTEICHTYISIHGCNETDMKILHTIIKRERTYVKTNYTIPPIVDSCRFPRSTFRWDIFIKKFYAKPKPCKDNPTWSKAAEYKGRLH